MCFSRWHGMTAHPRSGRPCCELQNGAGLKTKQVQQRKTQSPRHLQGIRRSISYRELSLRPCSGIPLLLSSISNLPFGGGNLCQPILRIRQIRAKDFCNACSSHVLCHCISSSSTFSESFIDCQDAQSEQSRMLGAVLASSAFVTLLRKTAPLKRP